MHSPNTESLQEVMASLPKSGIKIREMLAAASCKGRPHRINSCPLGRFLSAKFGGQFSVGRAYVVRRRKPGDVEIVASPAPVATFIEGFDGGLYPDLVEIAPGHLRPIRRTTFERKSSAGKAKPKRYKQLNRALVQR